MKIAVVFYGYARTIGQLINEYRMAIPKNSDIFIYTYDTFYPRSHEDIHTTTDNVTHTSLEYFENIFGKQAIKLFRTRKYNKDQYIKFINDNHLPQSNFARQITHRTCATFDSIRLAINLKKEYEASRNFKYDCVILTRLDLQFKTPIIIPSNLNKLSYPIGEGWFPDGKRKLGAACVYGTKSHFNDQIIIGKSDLVDKIGEIFDNIIKMNKEHKIEINNETLIGWYCILNKINYSSEDICTYQILR
jgi:hypothetical protein